MWKQILEVAKRLFMLAEDTKRNRDEINYDLSVMMQERDADCLAKVTVALLPYRWRGTHGLFTVHRTRETTGAGLEAEREFIGPTWTKTSVLRIYCWEALQAKVRTRFAAG